MRSIKTGLRPPLLVADGIPISNGENVDLRLSLQFNPELGSKTINVHIPGHGPICRLDVDGPPHRPVGRSHKHSLHTPDCPIANLPVDVLDRSDLDGKSMREVFDEFLGMASINFTGNWTDPT